MLSDYLNQTAEYRPLEGSDNRGQPAYGDPVTIPCRREPVVQRVFGATETTVTQQTRYFTVQSVSNGDMLDGKAVGAVTVLTGLNGETIGYEAVI